MKHSKKGRLWWNDGSCIRLCPEYRNHVWSQDVLSHRTEDGRAFRTLNMLDEHSRESLAIRVKVKLNIRSHRRSVDLFILRGVPVCIRSDTGPDFIAEAVRDWIKAVGHMTSCIAPGSPCLNGSRCAKPRSSPKAEGSIATPNEPAVFQATTRLRQRPSSRCIKGQLCIDFQSGPIRRGCSRAAEIRAAGLVESHRRRPLSFPETT